MRRPLLQVFGAAMLLAAAAQAVSLLGGTGPLRANAEPAALLKGCDDVPEAVALAETLQQRGLRIESYIKDIDRRKTELAEAEKQLTEKLIELRKLRQRINDHNQQVDQTQNDEITRIIAMYDQMKPEQAAQVLANLPPDFAAQILVRVQPETGARIMASVEPHQAAVLTSFMGVARANQKQE
ncbi:MotE family protein [Paracoccus sp. PAR01]|uniref:MotE family protein n=1 Tax=Paracoccus sp. PAR01 TaxID=2769282 RepID=UPI001786F3C6|nr:hypothetical protein [Paracoccus sp. PAR01]MBD9526602.1 hypothetical protein [Paracoccus sp. PAR01]